MNEEDTHIMIEVLNSDGDIKLTKMRNPRAIWQNNRYPDEYIFKNVTYVNMFSLIQENKKLQQERDKYKSIVEVAIEYIKHSWWLRLDQVYDTSKDLQGWEVEQLFEILNKIKELEEGVDNGNNKD